MNPNGGLGSVKDNIWFYVELSDGTTSDIYKTIIQDGGTTETGGSGSRPGFVPEPEYKNPPEIEIENASGGSNN